MKLFSSKRRIAAAVFFLLLLLYFLRPGASRLKSRVILSISSSLGRSVDVGSVQVRLLPRPGFDLENLVVYDDPAFGAEPILRASEVTADLRLMSLVRGRLEVSRLDLSEPSLNLVHGLNGRWNLEALLERSAHTPLAPTAKTKSEPRPAFPYIEASEARINFKNGPEKTPYALTNADFSLWQDSENTWGLRVKAQPFRSDLNLSDTGRLRINGTWQRAATLRETPLNFTLEWDGPQLGQLTKLFTGNDQGWRGAALLDVTISGTPGNLQISSDGSIQDFRRYDITSGTALRLAAHCDARYSTVDHGFHGLSCSAPVGNGSFALKGDLGLPSSHHYSLLLTAENVPLRAAVALVQRSKKNLPLDLTADGVLRARVSLERQDQMSLVRLDGKGEIVEFRMGSESDHTQVGPETIPFVCVSGAAPGLPGKTIGSRNLKGMEVPAAPHLEFGPFSLGSTRGTGPTARGWANTSGYGVALSGEVDVSHALRLARIAGIPALPGAPAGSAQVDLFVAGHWGSSADRTASFSGPEVTGTAKLHNVPLTLHGTAGPAEIASADIQLAKDAVHVTKLNARAGGTLWSGTIDMPRGCGTPAACEIHFNLGANQIVLGELQDWISPQPKQRPWYQILNPDPQQGPTLLRMLRATGQITADRLHVENVPMTHVSANLHLGGAKLQVSHLNAQLLGGTYRGEWHADFSAKPAACDGKGSVSGISLARLAVKDPWITGTANGSYQVEGFCGTDPWKSIDGALQFDVRNGSLPHISLTTGEDAVRIIRLSGEAQLQSGTIEMKNATLDSGSDRFLLKGTATVKHDLDLKLVRGGAGGYSISGTLAAPRIAPLAGTEQARLKR
ncbi:MAG TPA: AsmA family protein [Verrucomicrobiae bacterium]|nr:AsmA family protein [Verrucomicrobiae bacterium]